jgi:hypothetical protein
VSLESILDFLVYYLFCFFFQSISIYLICVDITSKKKIVLIFVFLGVGVVTWISWIFVFDFCCYICFQL